MSNKKYHQFDAGTPVGTDLLLFGDPASGELNKVTIDDLMNETGPMQTLTVNVSAAEIIAMFVTPKVLIAAVPNKFPVFFGIICQFTAGSTQFTLGGNVTIEDENGVDMCSSIISATEVRAATSVNKQGEFSATLIRRANNAIRMTNSGAAFATGDGTMKITMYYKMYTVS